MIAAFRQMMDRLTGAGDAAVTVPPMDGAFKPNTALEDAPLLAACPAADNLVDWDGALHLTSGAALLRLDGQGGMTEVARFDGFDLSWCAVGPW